MVPVGNTNKQIIHGEVKEPFFTFNWDPMSHSGFWLPELLGVLVVI